jgi:hypothetical protein
VSVELELLRQFRAEDGAVDAASADAARSRLLAHIAATGQGEHERGRAVRGPCLPRLTVRVRGDFVAVSLGVMVVIAVVSVFLSVGGTRVPEHPAYPVLRSVAPKGLPPLPGQLFCDADLAPPGAIPGLGGPRSGIILVTAATVRGVNESPFSITARGLAPGGYAVWITQVDGLGSEAVPVPGAKPRLFGMVVPEVGGEGRIAVEGVVPSDISGTYLVRITLQSDSTVTKPGRTVLEGVGPL